MNDPIDDLLPFYANHTLSPEQAAAVESHLQGCPQCQQRLAEWQSLAGSFNRAAKTGMFSAYPVHSPTLPPLSPLVTASLKRRSPLPAAIYSAVQLIWVQRIILSHEWVLPFLSSFIVFGFFISFVFGEVFSPWIIFPPVAAVPMVAAILTALLYSYEEDPGYEIISAAPTSQGTLILARQTLALGALSLLAFAGSLLLVVVGLPVPSLFNVVAAWLGPMLLLSALTTVLSLRLPPQAAAGAALMLWGAILILLAAEQSGVPMLKISLRWLLTPTWSILLSQAALAGLLWLASWRWLWGAEPGSRHSVGG